MWEISDGGNRAGQISKCLLWCTRITPCSSLPLSAISTTLPSLSHFTPYHVCRGLSDPQFSQLLHCSPQQSRTMSTRACRSTSPACACVFARYSSGQSSPMSQVPCCMCTHSPLFSFFSYCCVSVRKISDKKILCPDKECSGSGLSCPHLCYNCCTS
jgi:hypothetical protein